MQAKPGNARITADLRGIRCAAESVVIRAELGFWSVIIGPLR
jgi:hypothetical protein